MEADNLSLSYIVASYNVGQNYDYKQLLIRNGKDSPDSRIKQLYKAIKPGFKKDLKAFNLDTTSSKPYWEHPNFHVKLEDYKVFSESRVRNLKNAYVLMEKTCDIVLLQEVTSDLDVDFVKNIFSTNFDWAYDVELNYEKKYQSDALIGWNNKKFTEVKNINLSIKPSKKAKSVLLFEEKTKMYIHATSLHASGFKIYNPTYINTRTGDAIVSAVIENFKENQSKHSPYFSIVGGDFNSQFMPSYYSTDDEFKLSQNRFKILEKEGFLHVPQDQPTAYNPDIASKNEGRGGCDLDHIYFKNGAKSEPIVTELKTCSTSFPIEDPSKNGSDHRPLFFQFKLNI